MINRNCQLTMYPSQIGKLRIVKSVSTDLFDLDKDLLKDNFAISWQKFDEYKS